MGEKIKEFLKLTNEIIKQLEKLAINLISLIGWIAILIFTIKGIFK
ncbi:hypothetical protein G8S21_04735 [Clostridium botulinum C]|nr:hypothetical protein [Clostridium botulinum]MCD3245255.1 hypothetical protein [Clostridium botulinum C]MCD3261634.1 hypothetical protein [Clostridium botulinum C]QPW56494.1 hypothetical protein IRP61_10575 [Clostridium botulinum]